jgi:hypothetical protein
MKKKFFSLFFPLLVLSILFSSLVVLVVPTKALMVEPNAIEDIAYRETETGNVHTAGQELTISKPVEGDLLIAGGQIIIKENIGENLIGGGGAVQVDGDVNGDAMVFGGVVIINGDVWGDLRIFAGEVYINSEIINGDLLVGAGEVNISEQTVVNGEMITNEGRTVNNGVFLNVVDNPQNLEDSRINSFYKNYNMPEMKIDSQAIDFINSFGIICNIIWVLGSLLAGYVVIKLFPVFFNNTVATMDRKALIAIMTGFLTLIVAVFAALILLVSIIGIPLLLALSMFAFVAGFLADVYARYMVGKLLIKNLLKIKGASTFVTFSLGYLLVTVVLWLLGLLPILGALLGGLISSILNFWGLGAIIMNKLEALRK